MQGLKCLPEVSEQVIVELRARIGILSALSRIFSAGGENLSQTLPGLIQAYSNWLDAEGDPIKTKGEKLLKHKAIFEITKGRLLEQLKRAYECGDKSKWVFEFNRLFVGPKTPTTPPYESVYRYGERLVMQDSTLEVRRWYRAEGLVLAGPSNEPDDFIATELEFVAYMLANALAYFQQNKTPQALAYLENYNAFYQDHLAIWLPRFVQSISTFTKEQIFIIVGELILRSVIPLEVRSLQSI